MTADLSSYRASPRERNRIADLFALIPTAGESVLDIGARDGFLSRLLVERFHYVVSLDLECPNIDHPAIHPVKGDVCELDFDDNSFDVVICAEVLEHISPRLLQRSCSEICRVARNVVVIGVPFKQDLRCGQSTCQICGRINPPWGHVNVFDKSRLVECFPTLQPTRFSFVGQNRYRTNVLSMMLMNFAGNPYGTYAQEEPCIHCGSPLGRPQNRSFLQKAASRAANILNDLQSTVIQSTPTWIHGRFEKTA